MTAHNSPLLYVKLGFIVVYIKLFCLFLPKDIDSGYSLELPRRGGSNEYHNLCFEQEYEKYQNVLSENFRLLVVKFSIYSNRRVYVMTSEPVLLIHSFCSIQ